MGCFSSESMFKGKASHPPSHPPTLPSSPAPHSKATEPNNPPTHPHPTAEKEEMEAEYVGCFSSESMFKGKVYSGGASGANHNLIKYAAAQQKKR